MSYFELTILPPLPFLNYKRNLNTNMGVKQSHQKLIFNNHSEITHMRTLYKSLIELRKSRCKNHANHSNDQETLTKLKINLQAKQSENKLLPINTNLRKTYKNIHKIHLQIIVLNNHSQLHTHKYYL